MQYHPCASLLPINTSLPLQVMSMPSSLRTVTPSLVNIDMFPSSAVSPTLSSDDEKMVDKSASAACLDNCGKGSDVTNSPLLVPPLAPSMRFVGLRRIGRPAIIWSYSLT